MDADGNELECRVCRSGSEEGRPLYFPCMCSGSIGAVHQDCLEAWLNHSKKDTCELCLTKYCFEPHYADGTPTVIPLTVFTATILKLSVFRLLPALLRVSFAFVIWVLIVPVLTSTIYCMCVGRSVVLSVSDLSALRSFVVHGFTIDAVMALSLLILISFTDFLRFHLVPAPPEAAVAVVGADGVPIAADAPPAEPNVAVPLNQQGVAQQVNANHNMEAVIPHTEEMNVEPPQPHGRQPAAPEQLQRAHPLPPGRRDMTAAARSSGIYSRADNPLYRDGAPIEQEEESKTGHRAPLDDSSHHPYILSSVDPPWDLDSDDERVSHTASSEDNYVSSSSGRRRADNYKAGRYDQEDDVGDEDDEYDDRDENDQEFINVHHGDQDEWRYQAYNNDPMADEGQEQENDNNGQGLFGAAAPAVEDEGPGQGQGQAWPQEAGDAPLEGLFGDENMDNLEGLQEANVEVRLAIFEILGVEGPFHLMFRNSFWLLGFCALYLFFTAMLPFVIGNMLFKLIATYAQPAAFLVPSSVKLMVSLIQSHSTEAVPLQFLDFFFIFGGCCGVFIAVFLMDCLATGLLRLKIPNTLKIVLELINKLAVVIKVGSLLLIRIFLLPLCLGTTVVVLTSHTLLPFTIAEWAHFIALHCLGAFAVAWVCGITFMLTVTISVLQLREVLHPAILGQLIRPQEPHADLINSLIQEGGPVHIRRIFISLLVYLLLIGLLLWVPMMEYQIICKAVGVSHLFTFQYWYLIPEIQIPLELMVSHLTFLSLLDKHKDVIGRLQHMILVFLCEKLNMTRFILPLPQLRRPLNCTDDIIRVGAPLRRPPAGWDIRTPNQSTRWAWGTEEPSALERNVAPRVTPSFWLARSAALVLLCYFALNLVALFFVTVPLPVGRALSALVYLPTVFHHDPLLFVVGCIVFAQVCSGLYQRVPKWETCKEAWAAFMGLSVSVVLQFGFVVLHLVAAHVCLSIVLSSLATIPTISGFNRSAIAALPAPVIDASYLRHASWALLSAWPKVVQAVAVSVLTAFLSRLILTSNGVFAYLETLTQEQDSPALSAFYNWVAALKNIPFEVQLALNNRQFSVEALKLREIQDRLLRPLIFELFVQCLLVSAAIALGLCFIDRRSPLASPHYLVSEFQLGVYFYLLRQIGLLLYYPLKSLLGAINKQVLNDNYLIGRTLVNSTPQSRAATVNTNNATPPVVI